jgi:hypothetical protein
MSTRPYPRRRLHRLTHWAPVRPVSPHVTPSLPLSNVLRIQPQYSCISSLYSNTFHIVRHHERSTSFQRPTTATQTSTATSPATHAKASAATGHASARCGTCETLSDRATILSHHMRPLPTMAARPTMLPNAPQQPPRLPAPPFWEPPPSPPPTFHMPLQGATHVYSPLVRSGVNNHEAVALYSCSIWRHGLSYGPERHRAPGAPCNSVR